MTLQSNRVPSPKISCTAAPRLESLEPRRFLSAGDPDLSFSGDGKNVIDLPGVSNESANAALVQPDGKVLLAGRASVGGELDFFVARLLESGSLDTGFGGGDGFVTIDFLVSDEAQDLALDGTNRIVVVGTSSSGAGTNARDFAIARLTATGTLDTSFSTDGKTTVDFGTNDDAMSVALHGSAIYVGGYKDLGTGNQFALAKLLSNGNPDTSYSADGEVFFGLAADTESRCYDIAVDAAGRVVMVGWTRNLVVVGSTRNFSYARVGTNALLDDEFSDDGVAFTDIDGDDEARSVAIDVAGRIVTSGFSEGSGGDDLSATRLFEGGSLDSTFNGDGRFILDLGGVEQADDMALHPDGTITLSGSTSVGAFQAAVVQLNPYNGSVSTTFGDGGDGIQLIDFGGIDDGFAVAIDPRDFRPVVAGNDGGGRVAVARLNDLIDRNFNSSVDASQIIPLPDGKLLVGPGTIRRLNKNGSLDATFTPIQPITNGRINDVAIDNLGRIVVAGDYNDGDGRSCFIRRCLPDGTPDASFSGDGSMTFRFLNISDSNSVHAVAIDAQNRIVVGGGVTTLEDTAIARITTSGVLDTSFSGNGVNITVLTIDNPDFITDLVIQPSNGMIVAVGERISLTGQGAFAMRFGSNGSLDASFGDFGVNQFGFGELGFYDACVALDSSERILVGGTSVPITETETFGAIARLNTAGSLDSSFSTDGKLKLQLGGGGTSESIHSISLDSSGNIYTTGRLSFDSSGSPDGQLIVRKLNPNGTAGLFDFSGDGAWVAPVAKAEAGGINNAISSGALANGALLVGGVGGVLRLNVSPAVVDFEFRFETAPQNIRAQFNDHLGATISDTDLVIRNVTTNTVLSTTAYDVQPFDIANNRSTVNFNSILADGNYIVTYSSTGIENNQLANLAGDRVHEFFFLNGDANHDGFVNLTDFNILASNFGQSGRTFSQGNFDYDPAGNVDLNDFNVLASRFGMSLGAASATASRASGPARVFQTSRLIDDVSELL